MGFFKKKDDYDKATEALDEAFEATFKDFEEPAAPKEEWVWIEGYKGTDKDMKCLGFQYELGKIFTFDDEIDPCKKGFHLCPKLTDVFRYYPVGNGNRYFKVRALINPKQTTTIRTSFSYPIAYKTVPMEETDKRVAKKIELIEEVSVDDIIKTLYPASCESMADKFKNDIIQFGREAAQIIRDHDRLVETGIYSQEIIELIQDAKKTDLALALAKENISQDTRILILFK